MKKKKTRRSKQKHPDLLPEFNLKTRSDLLDQDYLHKLNDKELDWLNKFNKEYVNASLDSNPKKNLHNSKKLIKNCYDSNNARNRDVLTKAKASNQLNDYEEMYDEPSSNDYEDHLIDELDKKEIIESIEWLADGLDKDEDKLESNLISEIKKERS